MEGDGDGVRSVGRGGMGGGKEEGEVERDGYRARSVGREGGERRQRTTEVLLVASEIDEGDNLLGPLDDIAK